jgi:hypothetical protein
MAQRITTPGKASKVHTALRATTKPLAKTIPAPVAAENSGMQDLLSLAKARGLLAGGRTLIVRGRMPVELVAQAKRRTGITSDSKLLEAALASIALSDDYAEWLLAQRGTVSPELDLEF